MKTSSRQLFPGEVEVPILTHQFGTTHFSYANEAVDPLGENVWEIGMQYFPDGIVRYFHGHTATVAEQHARDAFNQMHREVSYGPPKLNLQHA